MLRSVLRVFSLLLMLGGPRCGFSWEQLGPYRYAGVDRIVAIGDVHGALPQLREVLRRSNVIDENDHWRGGQTHLVSVGDLLDRGPQSRGVMDLLMGLQVEAASAGGMVHVVMGNHEVMNLSGELNYTSKAEFASYIDLQSAANAIADEPPGFAGQRRAMALDGPYGSWLVKRPVAIVVNKTLFLHGGVSTRMRNLELDSLNEKAHAQLLTFLKARKVLLNAGVIAPQTGFRAAQAAAHKRAQANIEPKAVTTAANEYDQVLANGLLFVSEGPVWYRGTALCHPFTEQQTTLDALQALKADRVVIGHTPTQQRKIQSRMDGRVLRIDTGMNVDWYHGHPAALVITAESTRVVYTDLDETEVTAESNRAWKRPWGMSDAGLESFLKNARITKIEDLATGVTKPKRVTLEQGERKIRAVFKTLDTDPKLEKRRWTRLGNRSDRYQYEVAAYRLDRLLGFDMVPPAVLRTINGKPGVLQYWIEGAINEKDRRTRSIPYTGECTPRSQYTLMNVFDALIYNEDRTLANVLYSKRDWNLWLIDHTRAFRSDRKIPPYLRKARFDMTPQLRDMLAKIDKQKLAALAPYLHPKQISAIVARAKLVKRL